MGASSAKIHEDLILNRNVKLTAISVSIIRPNRIKKLPKTVNYRKGMSLLFAMQPCLPPTHCCGGKAPPLKKLN
jgi:hypothetical protein